MKIFMIDRCIIAIVLVVLIGFSSPCMAFNRSIALVDVAGRNGDSKSETFSVEHILNVAGIPFTKYDVDTDGLDDATQHAMVVIPGRLLGSTLVTEEKDTLSQYVIAGGILVTQRLNDSDLFSTFGVSGATWTSTRYTMSWNTGSSDPSLYWFDDSMEQTISLANVSTPINTTSYLLSGAEPLAYFDDTSIAVTKYANGKGYAYALGTSWKDTTLRNQLNRDGGASRSYSNGFEPTSDTIILFLRSIYQSHVAHAVWKHTSPYHSQATVMITHDIDSTSGMEMMPEFAQAEASRGVVATYNITTSYLIKTDFLSFTSPTLVKYQRCRHMIIG